MDQRKITQTAVSARVSRSQPTNNDNASPAVALHVRRSSLRAAQIPHDFGINVRQQVIRVRVSQTTSDQTAWCGGVVHQNVYASKFVCRDVNKSLHFIVLGCVCANRDQFSTNA